MSSELSDSQLSELLSKMDQLRKLDRSQEIYDALLKYKDTKSVDILWRLASAAIEVGRIKHSKTKVYEASEIIERAMALDGTNANVRKVCANVLRYTGEYEGPKAQVQNSYIIKAHLELARQMNPRDPAVHYSLGCWSFAFADIGHVTRKLAGSTGVKPPKSSYDEAKNYFAQAEELSPGFSAMNLYMLGKTLHRLNDNDTAVKYLVQARDYSPLITQDDHEAHTKSKKLLDKLKHK